MPPAFAEWIKTPRNNLSVCFGPKQSFVAWDDQSVRCSNVPADLEESLQEWICDRQKWGALKFVCLGQDSSFLAATQNNGWCSGNLPSRMRVHLPVGREADYGRQVTVSRRVPVLEFVVGN